MGSSASRSRRLQDQAHPTRRRTCPYLVLVTSSSSLRPSWFAHWSVVAFTGGFPLWETWPVASDICGLGCVFFINLFLLSLLMQLAYFSSCLFFFFWLCSLNVSLSLEEIICSDFSKCFLTCQNKSSWAWCFFCLCVCARTEGMCQGVFTGTAAELVSSGWTRKARLLYRLHIFTDFYLQFAGKGSLKSVLTVQLRSRL